MRETDSSQAMKKIAKRANTIRADRGENLSRGARRRTKLTIGGEKGTLKMYDKTFKGESIVRRGNEAATHLRGACPMGLHVSDTEKKTSFSMC